MALFTYSPIFTVSGRDCRPYYDDIQVNFMNDRFDYAED